MNVHDHETERGHSLIPDSDVLKQVPKLYETDGLPFDQKTIYAKFFCGAATWLIAELDQDEWLAFGYCDLGLGFPEWGYVSLHELGSLKVDARLQFHGEGEVREGTIPVYAERDLHWTPKPFGEIQGD